MKQVFHKYNSCQFISDQEFQDMIDVVEMALFYLKLTNSGNLLIGVYTHLDSLERKRGGMQNSSNAKSID